MTEYKRKPRTPKQKADVLEAVKDLKKKFGKNKWFDFAGTGSVDGKFILIVGSKTKPSPRRVNQCCEHKGYEVVICGPWEKSR